MTVIVDSPDTMPVFVPDALPLAECARRVGVPLRWLNAVADACRLQTLNPEARTASLAEVQAFVRKRDEYLAAGIKKEGLDGLVVVDETHVLDTAFFSNTTRPAGKDGEQ